MRFQGCLFLDFFNKFITFRPKLKKWKEIRQAIVNLISLRIRGSLTEYYHG